MSASRTRRQMIQRMGRILRRKQPGVAARFVIMFAKDTVEDPTNRIERDGFLDEIERISEATGVFDSEQSEALDRSSPHPARRSFPSRSTSSATSASRRQPAAIVGQGFESLGDVLADEMGVEAAYAFLSFTRGTSLGPAARDRHPQARRAASPARAGRAVSRGRAGRAAARSRSRGSCPSGCRPDRRRWRSPASVPHGGSAAPGAARHHRPSSSGGRPSTRAWSAAASDVGLPRPIASARHTSSSTGSPSDSQRNNVRVVVPIGARSSTAALGGSRKCDQPS